MVLWVLGDGCHVPTPATTGWAHRAAAARKIPETMYAITSAGTNADSRFR
jgi:hypothetical protein